MQTIMAEVRSLLRGETRCLETPRLSSRSPAFFSATKEETSERSRVRALAAELYLFYRAILLGAGATPPWPVVLGWEIALPGPVTVLVEVLLAP